MNLEKVYLDNNNNDGKRPTTITIRLLANGTEIDSEVLNSSYAKVTINSETGERVTDNNTWLYKFTNLNTEDENGNPITYTVDYYFNIANKYYFKNSTEVVLNCLDYKFSRDYHLFGIFEVLPTFFCFSFFLFF